MNAVISSDILADVDSLFSIREKTALIIDGCRGHGLSVARAYVAAGARVYLASSALGKCKQTALELSSMGYCRTLNNYSDWLLLAEELAGYENHLDILVNNTGAGSGSDDWEHTLERNQAYALELTRALEPLLLANNAADDPARIINLGTLDGLTIAREMEDKAYEASKSVALHLTRVMGIRLGGGSVTVNAVAPETRPWVLAQDPDHQRVTLPGSKDEPADIAGMAIFLASRAGAYLTGTVIPVSI